MIEKYKNKIENMVVYLRGRNIGIGTQEPAMVRAPH